MSLSISAKSQMGRISHIGRTIRPTTPPTKPIVTNPEIIIYSTASIPATLFLSSIKDSEQQDAVKLSGVSEADEPMKTSYYA